jgi:hypothetical protein
MLVNMFALLNVANKIRELKPGLQESCRQSRDVSNRNVKKNSEAGRYDMRTNSLHPNKGKETLRSEHLPINPSFYSSFPS